MGSSHFGLKVAREESNFPQIPLVKGDRSLRERALPVGDNGLVYIEMKNGEQNMQRKYWQRYFFSISVFVPIILGMFN